MASFDARSVPGARRAWRKALDGRAPRYDLPVTPTAARLVSAAVLAAALVGCTSDDRCLVFAAASLSDALEDVGEAWEAEHPEAPVDFHFAGSNDLARQIASGAPADLFVAADRERLASAERVDLDAAVVLLGNELVVVAGRGERPVSSAADLLAFERLGLADPEAVPAGSYARAWLESEGVWDALRERVVPALDARANLAAVASGGVPVGVVYATDAVSGELAARVTVIFRVPEDEAPPIRYWAAPVDGGCAGAGAFLQFLEGPEAAAIFRRHGFSHPLAAREPEGRPEPAGA